MVPAAPPKPPPAEVRPQPNVQAAAPAARIKPHFVIGAGAGTRLALGRRYFAPGVSLRAMGVFERWELGVSGEWDAVFVRLVGSTPAGFAMSALVVGALFGRRDRVQRLDLRYGLGLGIASVAASADAEPGLPTNRSVDASQQRVGFYAGVCYPRDASTHLTLDVAGDAALSGLRGAATSAAGLPAFPRYGTGLWLGVETVAL